MANKKYNEFTAGTYDTSKIFLQADAVTGALEKVNLPSVSSPSYKVFRALLNQSSTGNPYGHILENTTLGTASMTRDSTGLYLIDFDITWVITKVFLQIQQSYYYYAMYIGVTSSSQIRIDTFAAGSPSDDCLYNTSIEMLIYP